MRTLGSSNLEVTEACLGTMTWGVQNSEEEAHAQLDYAVKECGVNFIDTAELYPVPLTAPEWRAGKTEEFIGSWLSANPEWREKIVLASKVAGFMPNSRVAAERTVPPTDPPPDCRLDRSSVRAACEASLRRLQTSYVDLYQLHWPDRYVPAFGATTYDFGRERDSVAALLEEGKIRAYGLSNETPYGESRQRHLARNFLRTFPQATIQNAYSLLTRGFEEALAEARDACSPRHHNVGLLPWSVLCGGLLTGKYRQGAAAPAGSGARFVAFGDYMSRWHPSHARQETLQAADAYSAIAEGAGLTPSQLAILWCRTRPFIATHGAVIICAVIIGGTSLSQLEENLAAFALPAEALTEEMVGAINEVHMRCRDPSNSL
ncbi:hypothetical protein EMIHUDRAFT_425873 [Emiliania huxleyi CCMP1516]|uniref:NADP-dependent oxidoreductase domain-containing protein n=2 Tax=Emiliania huxleyi TaxID=2903 RepID=A0A0D3JHQ2_EMIH1|nr:hypothetical protein EMIHUDRAFT_425873 [Emiliania huxleyi CCMP1516]EOD23037.1 hypothetical protein EMIHUDRAFT_425873 [Emiliania huxleyi CCMP1516]|eukprot:XP_005775466.1 hypothetical protein EMIHUDRAFT_425873 [Emiliania huxleyi CCMP1516]